MEYFFPLYLLNEIVGDVEEELLDVLVELLVGVHLLHQLLQMLLVQHLMESFAHQHVKLVEIETSRGRGPGGLLVARRGAPPDSILRSN